MTQVIQDAHEHDIIELLTPDGPLDVVYVALQEFDIQLELVAGERCLSQVHRIVIDADDALGAAALQLERIKAAVAANIQHCLAAEVVRQRVLEELPEV